MGEYLAAIDHVSECFVKPKYAVDESKQPYYLGPWDLAMLSVNYIQKGLLFAKPENNPEYSTDKFLDGLKESLSIALVHFYPLTGQLASRVDEDKHESLVYVDCTKGSRAKFIHATLDMTMSDILSPIDIPLVVHSFFDHHKAINYDGHTQPLLLVRITELLDGIFIGVSMNHVLADGVAYWHFWKTWSDIHVAKLGNEASIISTPPIHKRWLPDGYMLPVPLPFTHPDEFISRYERPLLRERIFHFSSESIATLKAKANAESNTSKISSFQALSALGWRSIVRANTIPHDETTNCRLAINNLTQTRPTIA